MVTLCTTKFNIQKFLEIYKVVEVKLHPFITTKLDPVWRCESGEDLVALPSQIPPPTSWERNWMAVRPGPDTKMNNQTRFMQTYKF